MPYAAFRDGDQDQAAALMDAARRAAGGAVMKVILETGALADPALIRAAGALAVECGADFLKTSTGKIAIGATLEHAAVLIEVIASSSRPCGLKLSGGVRTLAAASAFLALHDCAFGPGAAAPGRLRFGASSLLDELLAAAG
jgi:deoxyribose-phosphate aldolase